MFIVFGVSLHSCHAFLATRCTTTKVAKSFPIDMGANQNKYSGGNYLGCDE